MKNFILLLVALISLPMIAQDTIRLKHTNYISVYSKSLHYPVLVEWWETSAKSDCQNKLPRKDQFAPDPLLKLETNINEDYLVGNREQRAKNLKGFDRGHMCPARVNQCSGDKVQTECFYFSNMAPQYHALNGGDWKSLETYTFETSITQDSIHVWAGSLGKAKMIGKTWVPKQCWKVIYIKKTKTLKAFLFNNDTTKPDGYENNEVPVEAIEKLTGYKFKG
jgi:DNA/RNA endonuclease G (NUC1)